MSKDYHKTEKSAKIVSLIEFVLSIVCLVLFFVFLNNFKEDGYRHIYHIVSNEIPHDKIYKDDYGSLIWAIVFLTNFIGFLFRAINRFERIWWLNIFVMIADVVIFIVTMKFMTAKIFWLEIPFAFIAWLFASIIVTIGSTFVFEEGYYVEGKDYAKVVLWSILSFLIPMIGFMGLWLIAFIAIEILLVIITKREPISALIIIIF